VLRHGAARGATARELIGVTVTMSPVRRRFLEFLGSVVAVHIVALALYYGIDLPHSPAREQRIFAWVWMGVTVLVVLVGLQRIKRARRTRLTS
jgi:membrane protein DedA with SNARE-associated domain